jgi:DNA polymerase
VSWQVEQQDGLFSTTHNIDNAEIVCDEPVIPVDFIPLAKTVACFRDNKRWALLYSVAWRLVFENRELLDNSADEQVSQLIRMQKAVSRDRHKMKAFVRFKRITGVGERTNLAKESHTQEEVFLAWFEPEHKILPITAPFFAKRFSNMRWSILTPDLCAHWDQHSLTFSPGVTQPPPQADHAEDLWRSYYASIFNPARLKISAMQSEMPKKYWVNLPEAPLISELIRNAGATTEYMLEQPSNEQWSKTAKSKFVQEHQSQLHARIDKTTH